MGWVVQMHCGYRWDSSNLPSNLDNIELEDLPAIADSARQSAEQVQMTIGDQHIDTVWVVQARRELAELEKRQ